MGREFPQAWAEAAAYLAAQEGTGSTLVLPGSGFGQQGWGWTIDEPIQGLASTPWAARSQVPLTPGGTIRNLDAIQERIADGQGSPYLADLLARAGIEYVLVRRDLDLFASGAPDPARVDLAVSRSPGLVPAASFGRSGFGEQPMIDVYRVDREVSRVHAVDLDDVTTLAGGPEDVLTALESGALDPESPVVIAGEEHWPTVSPDVVADGYRKRERSFGRLEDALSEVMARDEPYRLVRSAHDYPGVPATERVYARYDGVASVTASTSGGYADTLGPVRPELGPYAAVDGLPETYWQSSPLTDPGGPVGRGALRRAHRARDRISVQAGVDGFTGAAGPPGARSTPGDQSSDAEVDPATGLVEVRPRRPTGRPRPGDRDRRGRDRGCRRAARDLHSRAWTSIASSSSPAPARPRHDLRAARAPAAARVHRRGPGCGLWLRHRRAGRRGGVGHGARDLRDRGRVVGRSRGRWSPAPPRRRSGCSSRSWRTPGYVGPRPTGRRPTWAPSSPSTVTRSASGRRRPPTPVPTLRLRWPHRRLLTSLGVVAPIGTAVAPTRAELTGNGGPDPDGGPDPWARRRSRRMRTRRLVIRFDAPTAADSAPGRGGRAGASPTWRTRCTGPTATARPVRCAGWARSSRSTGGSTRPR